MASVSHQWVRASACLIDVNAFVRLAVVGILSGCASHAREAAHVTLAPVAAGSVMPVEGSLVQPTPPTIIVPTETICDIDPSVCEKQSCAGHP